MEKAAVRDFADGGSRSRIMFVMRMQTIDWQHRSATANALHHQYHQQTSRYRHRPAKLAFTWREGKYGKTEKFCVEEGEERREGEDKFLPITGAERERRAPGKRETLTGMQYRNVAGKSGWPVRWRENEPAIINFHKNSPLSTTNGFPSQRTR